MWGILSSIGCTLSISGFVYILALSSYNTASAIPTSNSGREFYAVFMENLIELQYFQGHPLLLFATIAEKKDVGLVNVTYYVNNELTRLSHAVVYGYTLTFEIPHSLRLSGSAVYKKVVKIQSDVDIIVYGMNHEFHSNDGYLCLPLHSLALQYYAVAFAPPTLGTQVAIAAVYNITRLTITLATSPTLVVEFPAGSIKRGGEQFSITLSSMEVLQLQSTGDLSGTKIESDKQIAVYSGNIRTKVGEGQSRDHAVEQITPTVVWGHSYLLVPVPERTLGDRFRIVASESNTIISIHSSDNQTLHAGQVYEVVASLASCLLSSKPVMVAQIIQSQVETTQPADPSMISLPPMEQYLNQYTVIVPKLNYTDTDYRHHLIVSCTSHAMFSLKLNDATYVPHSYWSAVAGTDYVTSYIILLPGVYIIQHENSPFTAILYGVSDRESYGYPVGMSLSHLQCYKSSSSIGDQADNDCDGEADEEICDHIDNDGDGFTDEDCSVRGTSYSTKFMAVVTGQSSLFIIPNQKAEVTVRVPSNPAALFPKVEVMPFVQWTVSVGQLSAYSKSVIVVESTSPILMAISAAAEADWLLASPNHSVGYAFSGYDYCVTGYRKLGHNNQMIIISQEETTAISIRFPISNAEFSVSYLSKTYNAGTTLGLSLSPYSTLTLDSSSDFTGTLVHGSHPIMIQMSISNTASAEIPNISTLANQYYILSMPGRSNTDIVRVVSVVDSTQVTVERPGDYRTYSLQNSTNFVDVELPAMTVMKISADQPILVSHVLISPIISELRMAMVIFPAVQQYSKDYMLLTPPGLSAYAVITIEMSKQSGLRLDGEPLAPLVWLLHVDGLFVSSSLLVTRSHQLKHLDPAVTFQVVLYSSSSTSLRAYLAGRSYLDLSYLSSSDKFVQRSDWVTQVSSQSLHKLDEVQSSVCSELYPNCASNVFDGNSDTMWLAGSRQLPQFISWDVKQPLTVLSLNIISREGRLGRMSLLYSTAGLFGPWTSVKSFDFDWSNMRYKRSHHANVVTLVTLPTSISARYWRLTVHDTLYGEETEAAIAEIAMEVYNVVDGNWSPWSDWTLCPASCGGSTQLRSRSCTNPSPENGGQSCPGNNTQIQPCGEQPCPIDGGYTVWSPWSDCSKTCGIGSRERTRTCTNPAPQYGGDTCSGLDRDVEVCAEHPCPIDGGYGSWTAWSSCSATCGGSIQLRYRSCNNPAPQHGGLPCFGASEETRVCATEPCNVIGATGPVGSTGSTGVKGDMGLPGINGLPGAKGEKGDQGVSGIKGSQGVPGITGVKGEQGDIGSTGMTGAPGAAGGTGATGPIGYTGSTGPQGETGMKGEIGLKGSMGATGIKGVKGDIGPTGPIGPAYAGENECDGSNGGCEYKCEKLIFGFKCLCPDGYKLDPNKRNCTDINECESDNGGCQVICHNTDGSYYCNCVIGLGLSPDRHTCEDVDECSDPSRNNCYSSDLCINTFGSFLCASGLQDPQTLLSEEDNSPLLSGNYLVGVTVWLILLSLIILLLVFAVLYHRRIMHKQGDIYLQYIRDHPPTRHANQSVFAFPSLSSVHNFLEST